MFRWKVYATNDCRGTVLVEDGPMITRLFGLEGEFWPERDAERAEG